MTRRNWILGTLIALALFAGIAYAQQTKFEPYGAAPTISAAYDLGLLGNVWRDVYTGGHLVSVGGTQPTCAASCGTTATILGSDTAFVITTSATSLASPMVVTFGRAFGQLPACTAANQTTAANYVTRVLTTTTTASIYTAAGPTTADKISVICAGAGG